MIFLSYEETHLDHALGSAEDEYPTTTEMQFIKQKRGATPGIEMSRIIVYK